MRILVLQHAAAEHPGTLRDILAAQGHVMHQVELDESEAIPPLSDYDIMLVMGGPMDVWETDKHPWLIDELEAIRDWVADGRPFLGLCLGAQLLAAATGGGVRLMAGPPEVGICEVTLAPDPLFAGIGTVCPCFQWHGAEVFSLPPGGRLLASSPGCAIQGFGLGPAAYGLQFHMELTATTAAEWGALPEYAASLEALRGPGALPALQAEVAKNLAPLQAAGAGIFNNFLRIAAENFTAV
jgi:GMP synthase-like glutamine amidotransferase